MGNRSIQDKLPAKAPLLTTILGLSAEAEDATIIWLKVTAVLGQQNKVTPGVQRDGERDVRWLSCFLISLWAETGRARPVSPQWTNNRTL